MSSTNKTTNYQLSQFIATDKPAWLTDYNQDMAKIDAGIDAAQDTATGAEGKADANTTNIGDLSYLSTSAKNTLVAAINEIDTASETAQSTATSASNDASTALTQANAALSGLSRFNLTQRSTLTPSATQGTLASSTYIRFATDTTSSIFKLYGRFQVSFTPANTGTLKMKLGSTTLRPSEDYVIEAGAYMWFSRRDASTGNIPLNIEVKTNGDVFIQEEFANVGNSYSTMLVYIPPCLYFNSNFGD